MKRVCGLLLTVLAITPLAGCATMRVSSHVDREVQFTRYRTFDWGMPDERPETDPRLQRNPLFQDHVQGAIERQMAKRGFARAEVGSEPDVRVHFHAVIERRLDVNGLDYGRGYCVTNDCGGAVRDYEAGTLVVDVVDARTNRLVWRGWAQDSMGDALDNPDRLTNGIEKAVARILAQLPASR
jgi:hypothetical protein